MFSRKLTADEAKRIKLIESFVRNKHKESDSHDFSHVLEVTQYAIKIASRASEPVDPFILICGALLHDIGKTNLTFKSMHGLIGSAIAEEFLDAMGYTAPDLKPVRDAICRIVARHTPTTMVPPETTEEKIVFDADCLDRLGVIGVLRGFIGKSGSIAQILEQKMKTRVKDYEKLHYEESRKIGKKLNEQTLSFIAYIRKELEVRRASIEELELDEALDEKQRLESGVDEDFE
jgi:uncharacterized protein